MLSRHLGAEFCGQSGIDCSCEVMGGSRRRLITNMILCGCLFCNCQRYDVLPVPEQCYRRFLQQKCTNMIITNRCFALTFGFIKRWNFKCWTGFNGFLHDRQSTAQKIFSDSSLFFYFIGKWKMLSDDIRAVNFQIWEIVSTIAMSSSVGWNQWIFGFLNHQHLPFEIGIWIVSDSRLLTQTICLKSQLAEYKFCFWRDVITHY